MAFSFTPNPQQIKSGLRWLLGTFGAGFAGYVAAKLNIDVTQITQLLTSEAFIGILASIVTLILGLVTHTKANLIANTAALPEVKEVSVTTKALADAVPADNVVKK